MTKLIDKNEETFQLWIISICPTFEVWILLASPSQIVFEWGKLIQLNPVQYRHIETRAGYMQISESLWNIGYFYYYDLWPLVSFNGFKYW